MRGCRSRRRYKCKKLEFRLGVNIVLYIAERTREKKQTRFNVDIKIAILPITHFHNNCLWFPMCLMSGVLLRNV